MPRPRLDAVGVTTSDLDRTVAFYRCLGFEFADFSPEDSHVEAIPLQGETRLMIDSAEMAEQLTGSPPVPPNHSVFALLCKSPAEVDALAEKVASAGFVVKTAPWDAFWGQRYATLVDPDGYALDLFASLAAS